MMSVHHKMDKVDLKKKLPWKFCIFFQSTHQVDMKNVVECPREFIAYFNALETTCERSEQLQKQNVF